MRVQFAYIKATEGGDFRDPDFARNWAGADVAGIARGAYHFYTLGTPGRIQAANFLATVPVDREALPPAIDLEIQVTTGVIPKLARSSKANWRHLLPSFPLILERRP